MTPPPVAVLMAVKNGMPYLPEAVESVLGQTWKDFEFWIVDDHSTDGSLAYLQSLTDSRLRLLQSPFDGQTLALNFALRQIQSPWIARMDGDDVCEPERLAKQWSEAQRHPNAPFISADYWFCDSALRPIAPVRLHVRDPKFTHYVMKRQNPFCHSVMMFSKNLASEAGNYPSHLHTAQDFALWRSLLQKGPFAHVPEPLLKYRLHHGSVSLARYDDQRQDRSQILMNSRTVQTPTKGYSSVGLEAYRIGFVAWIAGDRRRCWQEMWRAIRWRVRVRHATAALLLSLLPRKLYMTLTGYSHVYR